MADSPIEIIEVEENSPIHRADSEEELIKTKEKMSALEIAWEYTDTSTEAALQKYKSFNLRFKDLATLTDKDLEQLGITDANTRAKMLENFSNLPGQDPSFDEVLQRVNMNEYNTKFIRNIVEHLDHLKKALEHAYGRILIKPPEDTILPDKKLRASDLISATLRKMMDQCDEMQIILQETYSNIHGVDLDLSSGSSTQGHKELLKTVFLFGTFLLGIYVGQKYLRLRLK